MIDWLICCCVAPSHSWPFPFKYHNFWWILVVGVLCNRLSLLARYCHQVILDYRVHADIVLWWLFKSFLVFCCLLGVCSLPSFLYFNRSDFVGVHWWICIEGALRFFLSVGCFNQSNGLLLGQFSQHTSGSSIAVVSFHLFSPFPNASSLWLEKVSGCVVCGERKGCWLFQISFLTSCFWITLRTLVFLVVNFRFEFGPTGCECGPKFECRANGLSHCFCGLLPFC